MGVLFIGYIYRVVLYMDYQAVYMVIGSIYPPKGPPKGPI